MNTQNVILLDGGLGQELFIRAGKPNNPLWSTAVMQDQPNLVTQVHKDFIQAGAQIITLNTYTATPTRLKASGIEDEFQGLQNLAIDCTKQAQKDYPNVQIAGCLPPLVASYRTDLSPNYQNALDEYQKIVRIQAPHVNLFLCETLSTIAEATAAADAALTSNKPVYISFSVNDDAPNTLRSGESLEDALTQICQRPIAAVLLNCSSPETIDKALPYLAKTKRPFGAYPNGFANVAAMQHNQGRVKDLTQRKNFTPQQFANFTLNWVQQGATIVGGCCEVSPTHIAHLHAELIKENYLKN